MKRIERLILVLMLMTALALLVGCGGVGRMMAKECYLTGAALTVVEMNLPLAEALAAEFREKYPNAPGSIRVLGSAPEDETYRIQELTLPLYHALCLQLEDFFWGEPFSSDGL